MKDQAIDVMISTGEWITVATWAADEKVYNAAGWLAEYGKESLLSEEPCELPDGTFVKFGSVMAMRARSV